MNIGNILLITGGQDHLGVLIYKGFFIRMIFQRLEFLVGTKKNKMISLRNGIITS